MEATKQQEENNIPIPFNKTVGYEKLTFLKKTRNAGKMILDQGFGAFLYKMSRVIIHKKQDIVRKIFYPNAGKELRETAKIHFLDRNPLPTLSIVNTVMGQHDLTKFCINKIIENQIGEIELVIMDGKGDFEIKDGDLKNDKVVNIKIIRDKESYPAFKFWMEQTTGDIMLFMHNDVIISDHGFDSTLRYVFYKYPKIGVVGFLGSDEIDEKGSRLWGATSNWLGNTYEFNGKTWKGFGASNVSRQQWDGLSASVVIDGCAMAMRRSGWIPLKEKLMPVPYYDYDRIVCLRYQEMGWRVATLGLAMDHISNMTGANELKWHENVKNFGQNMKIETISDTTGKTNWDLSLHAASKRLFLKEWRDEKKMIPKRVDWKV